MNPTSPSQQRSTSGFVYVAPGQPDVDEAHSSVGSLRKHNPGVRVCLITDRSPQSDAFDDVVRVENPSFSFADKLLMVQSPYKRSVFLDTDTLILGDLRELFELLDTHQL